MKGTKCADDLDISPQYLRFLCRAGRIEGAKLQGKTWILPDKIIIYKARRKGRKSKLAMVDAPEAS